MKLNLGNIDMVNELVNRKEHIKIGSIEIEFSASESVSVLHIIKELTSLIGEENAKSLKDKINK